MNGFSCPPVLAPPPAAPAEAIITNDGWFPDIDPAAARLGLRVKESVTAERLRRALIGAIITTGNQLVDWQATQLAAGYATFGAVPTTVIDGKRRLVLLYERAIGSYAKAELVEGYRDVDLTGAGQRKVEDAEPSIGELRRDAIHAIRDILKTTRTDIELI
ncbi:MAG: head completion/stabilization protein [Pseudomonadota bacterium]